jgi:hypothetical protein
MAVSQTQWKIAGDYFENCSCAVICPCVAAPEAPLTSQPTEGYCEAPLAFHIESGVYGDIALDGLNVVVIFRTPGPMAEGNGTVALYIDDRAGDEQHDALSAIFGGSAGGPMGALAPLVSEVLGVKSVPITYTIGERTRSVDVPGVLQLGVTAALGVAPDDEMWLTNAHPLFPEKIAVAVGNDGSTFEDYGLRWDNSGKSGFYAPFSWSDA